jgi:hypothetical protein
LQLSGLKKEPGCEGVREPGANGELSGDPVLGRQGLVMRLLLSEPDAPCMSMSRLGEKDSSEFRTFVL